LIEQGKIWRRVLELKIKSKRPMGQSTIRRFGQVLEEVKMCGRRWQEIEKERLWEEK
jgi:hypothetical protein